MVRVGEGLSRVYQGLIRVFILLLNLNNNTATLLPHPHILDGSICLKPDRSLQFAEDGKEGEHGASEENEMTILIILIII